MRKGIIMLDQHERLALGQLFQILEGEPFEPKPLLDEQAIYRGPDGQIIVPVVIKGSQPSLSLALLMAHKAEQLYKQTGCRFMVTQRLEHDTDKKQFVWAHDTWETIH